eukprot:scaffold200563_cov39-Tisochrysis_lutea.AAC.1
MPPACLGLEIAEPSLKAYTSPAITMWLLTAELYPHSHAGLGCLLKLGWPCIVNECGTHACKPSPICD